MLTFVSGKDLIWDTDNYDIVVVGTNTQCNLGNGFQSKMKYKYPELQAANDATIATNKSKIGEFLPVGDNPTILLAYICHSNYVDCDTLDYDALERVLFNINNTFIDKRVVMPVLGISPFDGNGDREQVLDLIHKHHKLINLTVYDYRQLHYQQEQDKLRAYKQNMKSQGKPMPSDEVLFRKMYLPPRYKNRKLKGF